MNVIGKIIDSVLGGQTSSSNLGDSSTKLLVLVTRNKLLKITRFKLMARR